ncbi:MAG: M28 family peptidase [Bacteroidales bacterium]|nr:MAG: M28 family peptidase [Bacteroidales bacterium]
MKYPALTILLMSLPGFLSPVAVAQDEFGDALMKQFHLITSKDALDWVTELSSPKYNGRLSGSPEYIAASEWVARNLREWGIKPGGDNGSYFQWFDKGYNEVHETGSLYMHIPAGEGNVIKKYYTFPDQFFPGMTSANGEITAEVVYIGYGVSAPEHNYDDYKGIDVSGKIVLMNRDVPYKDAGNPEYARWVQYCYHQYKLENAVKHGAAGMLYIDGTHANPNISYDPDFIWCGIGREPLNDIFAGSGTSNEEILEKINESMKPRSFGTGVIFTIQAETTWHPEGRVCNVIGIIEGTDPQLKDEVIIIGGHLDGVGNCGVLLPGALDNASGIADILGTAKAMALSGIPLKRSVMFLFIGGEEVGLLGSQFYIDHPRFAWEKTLCYINLDMVGNGTGFFIGSGKNYPGIYRFFEEANREYLHRDMRTSEASDNYGRPRSDGIIFSRAGIPTLGIGITGRLKPVYYHQPGDTPEMVTPEVMEDVSKLLYVAITKMAREDEPVIK